MATRTHSLVPRRILCATDLSANSVAALKVAVELARSCGAELRVLHVAELDADTLVLDSATRADIDRRLETLTQSIGGPPVLVSHVRREGDPCAEIVREVRYEAADLVVMGRHRPSPPDRAAGSLTEGVARRSPCPLMVVGSSCPAPPLRHLLCALDLGETSQETLAHAAALTAKLEADLLVLHVVAPPGDPASAVRPGQRRPPVEKDAEHELSTLLATTGLPIDRVRQRVVSGEPFPAILDAGRESECQLLVVGLHAGGVVARQFLGSTTLHLLRHQDCVLLLVPAPVSVEEEALEDESECVLQGRPPTRLEDPAAAASVEARVEW
jgi:nucleotide-binding universal stress UspA family protein